MEEKERAGKRKARRKRTAEETRIAEERRREESLASWVPKTELGKKVAAGEITSLNQIFEQGLKIMEPEIVDSLVPDIQEKLVEFVKTARVVSAGRQFSFRASVLVGNRNCFVGIGSAKDKERYPAIRKAARRAKLNLVMVHRGCGSWECPCGLPHSVPFKVEGKCASVRVSIMPAPKGLGLCAGENIKEVFRFAGVSDVWVQTRGSSGTTLNFVKAAVEALSKTAKMKLSNEIKKKLESREARSE